MGLSLAVEMASTGSKVIVIERGRPMAEASWAAAGMLAAHDPENPPALRPLSELSLQLYPDYLRRLAELSGREVPLRTRQTLQATRRGERFGGVELLSARALDYAQVHGYVEGLVCTDRRFLLLEEHSIDPRDLCAVLPLAAKMAGVTIIEDTAAIGIRATHSGIEVRTSAGLLQGRDFVDCRGAWAGESLTGGAVLIPTVKPRKGQMTTVEIDDPSMLRVVVRSPEIYLVPRGDGRVVIGATVEDAGFDKSVDDAAISRLLADATAFWPPLQRARTIATWAGLRPATQDSLPFVGATDEPHCWQAAGHFRNGILLAPATAVVMRQLLEGEAPGIRLEAFSTGRFARL